MGRFEMCIRDRVYTVRIVAQRVRNADIVREQVQNRQPHLRPLQPGLEFRLKLNAKALIFLILLQYAANLLFRPRLALGAAVVRLLCAQSKRMNYV